MKKQELLEAIPCPICGNKKPISLLKKGQFGLPCYVSICPNDGLVFLSPRWSKEKYTQFYQNEYDSYYRPSVFSDETDVSKYENIKTICSRLESLDLIVSRHSVLDVGAGMGWSLEWLKKNYNFHRLGAIESSEHCITNLSNVIKARVLANNIDSDWQSTEFDLIIMRHVLEHLMNPVEALRKIAKNLSADGIVYIAVPDMMNPKGSLKNYWFRCVHTFYFSKETLIRIALMGNLQPVKIKSEKSELWGVFRKTRNSSNKQALSNVYKKQINIIRAHKRKQIFFDLINAVKNLLPKFVKTWLNS
jgi:2-polyprenyl-3-methyl-5-hydroxy-6-metoxy-1,4-benzoquinol methylase